LCATKMLAAKATINVFVTGFPATESPVGFCSFYLLGSSYAV
jgi:hypothetical protein